MKLIITGVSGFVGANIKSYFKELRSSIDFISISRKSLVISEVDQLAGIFLSERESNVIHLAGKAHDLKDESSYSEYYSVNTDLSIKLFDAFLKSESSCFIILSSVKAVADGVIGVLAEDIIPNPITHYGKSKLLAEQYILSKVIPHGKRVYILRPCMIHGPRNKGNLNLLYKIVSKGFPWPLGEFKNKRSFCSIDNLCFILNELIENDQIPSGIYNVADDEPISTNELVSFISESQGKNSNIWNVPKLLIYIFIKIGDILKLPLNSETLKKLTESYVVSNDKIKIAINKPLPINSKEGLMKTFNSFNNA